MFSLLVLSLCFSVVGCGRNDDEPYFGTTTRKNKDPHTFYVNNGSEPEYLDPGMAHDTASSTLINHLFEGLTTYGPNAEPRPAVALSWDQTKDNRLFRFHLRKDAKWTDGKIVTAHDFEYAWKRVLMPKTASQSATALYDLKNGERFNRGFIKSAAKDLVVRDAAESSGRENSTLKEGTPLVILAVSPRKVDTAIAALDAVPEGITEISFDKSDPKSKTPEALRIGKETKGPVDGGGWAGKSARVVKRLAKVQCNGEDDHFFEVEVDGKRGILPGCVLADTGDKQTFSLVAKLEALPTWRADAPAADADDVPLGFVESDKLVSDPSVLGVRAKDDFTLEVELKGPTPYFIDLCAHATLFPVRKDILEPFAEKGEPDMWTRPESIVSNGPYQLESWKFRYEMTMVRNPHYYDHDKLQIHRIIWMQVEEYVQTLNLYKSGELDYIGDNLSLPQEYISLLINKKDFQRRESLGTYWYEFNTKTPPTNNVLVRRALNLAVDKVQLAEKLLKARPIPASHYVPESTGLGYSDLVKKDKAEGKDPFSTPDTVFNPERARELLGQAGFPVVKDGERWRAENFPSLELLYNTSEGHKQIAVAVQDMWKRHLGVSVTLRNEEWKVMLKNVRDRNFQVVRFGWIADYNHPQTFLDTLLSFSPNNRTGWSDGNFDRLVKQAALEPNVEASMKLYREAEKVAVDAMPKMPIYFYVKTTLVKPYVRGFFFNERNTHLIKYIWFDDDWQKGEPNKPAYELTSFPTPESF